MPALTVKLALPSKPAPHCGAAKFLGIRPPFIAGALGEVAAFPVRGNRTRRLPRAAAGRYRRNRTQPHGREPAVTWWLWRAARALYGEGVDSNSNTGIEPDTCIDSKADIAVKRCIASKKVFDTIDVKDS
jgi:hypothetical protein